MKKEPELIDLDPSQWKSERGKVKEPIFGSGALEWGLFFAAKFLIVAGLYYWRHW